MDLPAYVFAWLVYLMAATGLLLVVWRITRNWRWSQTKRVIRILSACVLLTPANMLDSGYWLAPAYLVAGYDWVLGNTDRASMAAIALSGAFTILLCMSLLEGGLRRLLHMEPIR